MKRSDSIAARVERKFLGKPIPLEVVMALSASKDDIFHITGAAAAIAKAAGQCSQQGD